MPRILKNALGYVETGRGWLFKIVPDPITGVAAGTVCIWQSSHRDEPIDEIGWMVLRSFQGRGLGGEATRMILERARQERRFPVVHAFTGVSNAPSNAICRKVGFVLIGACDILYAGRPLACNHYQIDLTRPRGAGLLEPDMK